MLVFGHMYHVLNLVDELCKINTVQVSTACGLCGDWLQRVQAFDNPPHCRIDFSQKQGQENTFSCYHLHDSKQPMLGSNYTKLFVTAQKTKTESVLLLSNHCDPAVHVHIPVLRMHDKIRVITSTVCCISPTVTIDNHTAHGPSVHVHELLQGSTCTVGLMTQIKTYSSRSLRL